MRRCILSILIWTTIFASAQTPVDTTSPTLTTASHNIDQISLTTPVASPTPIEALLTTDQPISETSVQEDTPTTTSRTNNPTINIITAPQTPLPISATSLVTDTREFSAPDPDHSVEVTTSQEYTETSSRGRSTGIVSATTIVNTAPEDVANGVAVGGQVAVSAFAFVVAIGGLTWVFAEF